MFSPSACLNRWRQDLLSLFEITSQTLTAWTAKSPVKRSNKSWADQFHGEVSNQDIHYSIFLVVASLVPAAIIARVSAEPQWKVMADFFAAPVQVIINGFLMASLLFLGSHAQRKPRPFSIAYKLMLRIMSAQPLLGFLLLSRWGSAATLLIYGFLVVVAAVKTYGLQLRNALLFFGVVYFIFTLMQFEAALKAISG